VGTQDRYAHNSISRTCDRDTFLGPLERGSCWWADQESLKQKELSGGARVKRARGKRRGFSPTATVRHSLSAVIHTDGLLVGSKQAVSRRFCMRWERRENPRKNKKIWKKLTRASSTGIFGIFGGVLRIFPSCSSVWLRWQNLELNIQNLRNLAKRQIINLRKNLCLGPSSLDFWVSKFSCLVGVFLLCSSVEVRRQNPGLKIQKLRKLAKRQIEKKGRDTTKSVKTTHQWQNKIKIAV